MHTLPRGGFIMAKKRLFLTLISVLLIVALLLPNLFTIAYASNKEAVIEPNYVQKGIVTASNLNFRSEASTSSKIIAVLPQGTAVTILEESSDWLKVKYESRVGYLFKIYVAKVIARGITTATSLNVRSEPTRNSQAIDLLYTGTQVFILEEIETGDLSNPVWLKISTITGSVGYVSKRYVNILTTNGVYWKTGVTTTPLLNVRTEPSFTSEIITRLYEGTHVIILDTKTTNDYYKKWYKIDYNGHIGWIAAKYLQEQKWTFASQGKTSSPSSGKNRNTNMSLASSALTGTIILPGETFSWIDTLGSCSANKGFLTATIFVNGKVSEGAGGGVCQVSTTFNKAIKKLDIETEAHPHSIRVLYANLEDEASVSYPHVDFSFTNTLETPILVEFVSNYGTVTCNVYIAK